MNEASILGADDFDLDEEIELDISPEESEEFDEM